MDDKLIKNDQRNYKGQLLFKTEVSSQDRDAFNKGMIDASVDLTFKPIKSIDVIQEQYNAEVFEKDNKYIYNFWEITDETLDPIFISVFRDTNRFGKRFVPELNCWSYVVKGFADNPFAASLKMKVFEELDDALNKHSRSSDRGIL